jgi:hypothetical protein
MIGVGESSGWCWGKVSLSNLVFGIEEQLTSGDWTSMARTLPGEPMFTIWFDYRAGELVSAIGIEMTIGKVFNVQFSTLSSTSCVNKSADHFPSLLSPEHGRHCASLD